MDTGLSSCVSYSYMFFLYVISSSEHWKKTLFHWALPRLMLHNWVWWRLLCMNLFDSNSKQFPALSCMSDTSLLHPEWLVVKARGRTQWCAPRSGSMRHASFWLASIPDNQAETHLSAPITVKQQEDRSCGRLIVDWEERGGGGDWGREKPLTSLSISARFLTLSVDSIVPSLGMKRWRSKTERNERKTKLSSGS